MTRQGAGVIVARRPVAESARHRRRTTPAGCMIGREGRDHGFVRDAAIEVAAHGIGVNAGAPRPIKTANREDLGGDARNQRRSPHIPVPMSRIGQPDAIVDAVAFVAPHEANFITLNFASHR
jgi:hypothetical protein